MDAEASRLEAARARNLEYIRQLDEKAAREAADELLREHMGAAPPRRRPSPGAASAAARASKNTSVYVCGLTTYTACKQLEGVCAKIGKVRRIKFYQDDRGGLKGDALVTFASHNMMLKAVERLNHLDIKPGVLLTATEAQFSGAKEPTTHAKPDRNDRTATEPTEPAQPALPERLFSLEAVQSDGAASTSGVVTDAIRHEQQEGQRATTELSLPSRSVILNHVWDPLAPQDDATQFFSELEDDMRHECGKHGRVEHVHILPTGGVMVRYEALASAIKCLQVMHGRWFDGRQIDARFDPSTPEEPEDDATKLDAFFASLG